MNFSFLNKKINSLIDNNNFRVLRNYDDDTLINLSSNDYLSISKNKFLKEEFLDSFSFNGKIFSSTSSRLLDGNSKYYTMLEDTISNFYKKEVLVFNSGYHLNIGVLPSITTKRDLIIADKLVHSSLINGFKLSNAQIFRYKHLDYEMLNNYLEKNRNLYENVFIVTESIFSMDGDPVNLEKIIKIKEKYNCFLYLDEAHSVGIYGENGLGICENNNLIKKTDFIIGTFGKAYSSIGAFIVCDKILKDFLINKSPSLIYTTAIPPINLAWTNFIFKKVSKMHDERIYLQKISEDFIIFLNKKKYEPLGKSHIVPVLVKGNLNCDIFSRKLKSNNILALPIKSPTVPEGMERIRFSLNTSISEEEMDFIKNIISKIR